MRMMVLQLGIFAFGLFFLVRFSDIFIGAVSKFADNMKIPRSVTNSIAIALGTSLPLLMLSLLAVFKRNFVLTGAVVIGANVASVFLTIAVLGLVFRNIDIDFSNYKNDMILYTCSLAIFYLIFFDRKVYFFEGLILVMFLVAFVFYIRRKNQDAQDNIEDLSSSCVSNMLETVKTFNYEGFFIRLKNFLRQFFRRVFIDLKALLNRISENHRGFFADLKSIIINLSKKLIIFLKSEKCKNFLLVFGSGIMVYLSSDLVITAMFKFSDIVQMFQSLLGLSVLGALMVLPLIIKSVKDVRALKNMRNSENWAADGVISNLLRFCIFNAIGIIGLSALFGRLFITVKIFQTGFLFMVLSLLLFVFVSYKNKITLQTSLLFFAGYLAFLLLNFS